MAKKLTAYVHAKVDGEFKVLKPGDTVPNGVKLPAGAFESDGVPEEEDLLGAGPAVTSPAQGGTTEPAPAKAPDKPKR